MKLDLTLDEAQTLVNLLDLAVKAGGLPTAQVALPLFAKVKEAANAPIPTVEPEAT